ncbi:MAG TPA: ATP-binding protein [Solirubrobacteraceae bacterium]|jgi:anti-sigma regulatory factor (Ser/Thr protein kinase)|nr:ATP-binding protein [Solirubrobacteraceae bacterium]
MAQPPNIRLALSNRPENVVLVRETIAGLADAIELDAADLDDIRTAVTEACNNVVLHAYEGAEGALEVEIYSEAGACGVFVRDRGIGLQPRAHRDQWTVGIGLPVIEALAASVDFEETPGGGTEVRMRFATPGVRVLETPEQLLEPGDGTTEPGSTTTVTITPVAPLARSVLPRLLGVLAARANFSTDRISDAHLVADALSAHATDATSASHLTITVSIEPRNLELTLGPLDAGRARELISAGSDGVGDVLEKLSDRVGIEVDGSHELLDLTLTDPR